MKTKRINNRRHLRRGTIYAIVLLSSLLVATIGVSALQLVRLQSRTAADYSDFIAARAYARAAIDIGMLNIRNDRNWRTNFGNGNWVINKAIDSGTYSLSAVDPIDNDVTEGDNHPIILTGTGTQGSAAFRISTRLEVGPHIGSSLEVSMISGGNTTVTGATLTSDQSVSANGNLSSVSGSTVNADVEAFGSISGSTYTKTTTQRTVARDMPDSASALDYYLANGTTIPYTALTLWSGSELVPNSGFETGTTNWYANNNCVLQQSTTEVNVGQYALRVRGRSTSNDVAAMDLPLASLKNGNTYHLSVPIFAATTGSAYATLVLESTGDGVQTLTTPIVNVGKNASGVYAWIDLNADVVPTWTGTLTKATIQPWLSFRNDHYIDKVSFVDVTHAAGAYAIDSQLISPTVNPYGGLNPKGIYVVNCGGQDVSVGRSRIVGTLVFVDPGVNSIIGNAVSWEPAVSNYPALLTNQKLTIQLGSGGVSEAMLGLNLNPAGTPYPFIGGTTNEILAESYPSKISGLVYSSDQLKFTGASTLVGVVIANSDIEVNTATLNLSYVNTYFNDPPPGFDNGTITMKVVAGTWQRGVN